MRKGKRITLRLELWKTDGMTLCITTQSKRRIIDLAQVQKWKLAYLKVSYGNGHHNDYTYKQGEYKDLRKSLDAFLEEDLISELTT